MGIMVAAPTSWQICKASSGEKRDLGLQAVADLMKAVEIGSVAGVVDRGGTGRLEHIPAEAAVGIGKHAGTPMLCGRGGDCEAIEVCGFPPTQGNRAMKAKAAHEVIDAVGHDSDGCGQVTAAHFAGDRA